jgi:hypothetical protein
LSPTGATFDEEEQRKENGILLIRPFIEVLGV